MKPAARPIDAPLTELERELIVALAQRAAKRDFARLMAAAPRPARTLDAPPTQESND